MLESYISPFLLGYVDKYIKNLKPEDLRLSLWGGDLVLNNLELRLDALERDLNLPLSFVSGFIHELRIHVPWTRIGYEPVEISINTIECTVKLCDAEADGNESVSSKSSTGTSKSRTESSSKVKPKADVQDASLSPGYVTSLMNRVLHNVQVSIKNLVLKYVEDDIVLSVNVQSFATFATDGDWQKAYLELSLPELVLRRVCNFTDITVCLDKRSASGKIEVYQEPVTFRCAVSARMHMTYNSLNAKRVSAVKVSTHCEELKMSLSDTQLPMFLRVLQLVLALYYGSIDLQEGEVEEDQGVKGEDTNQTVSSLTDPDEAPVDLDPSSSWTSWAWSFVPEALTYDEDEDQEEGEVNRYGGGKLQKRQDTILSIGFFCDKASVEFKVTDAVSERSLYTRPKLSFQQTLLFEMGGMAIDILLKGEGFFAAQLGISHMNLSGVGSCPCGVQNHAQELQGQSRYVELGHDNYSDKSNNYLSLTLFDGDSPENNRQKTIYILDAEHHQSVYTEKISMKKYGAFWMDYLYTYEKLRGPDGNDSSSRSSHQSETDPIFTTKETSWKRFVFAPTSIDVGSSFVHRLQQFAFYAGNHDYQPYSTPQPEVVNEKRAVPTPGQVAGLEDCIPQRHSHFAILGLHLIIRSSEHGDYDPSGSTEESAFSPVVPDTAIPAVKVQCERVDYQVTVPMYARQLIAAASKVSHPSSALMHLCYGQKTIKVFGLQAGLTCDPCTDDLSPQYIQLLQPCSFAGLSKSLCLPMYWTDPNILKSEMMLEVPSVRLDFTKAQLLLLIYIQHSWMGETPRNHWLHETSLMQDVFTNTGSAVSEGQVQMVACLSSVEYRYVVNDCVKAVSGSVGQGKVAIKHPGGEVPTPVFQGPLQTSKCHLTTSIVPTSQTSASPVTSPRMEEACLVTITAQIPQNDKHKGSLGALLLKIEGTAICLDPVLYSWLLYQPGKRSVTAHISKDSPDRIEKSLPSEMRSPPKKESSQGTETYKGPKSGGKFSRQKSQTATAVMESDDVTKAKGSSQVNRFHESIGKLKELIIQVDVSPCIVAWPTKHLAFPSPDTSITQCLCDLMTPGGQGSDSPPSVLVVCVPALSVHSSGHKAVDADQDIPLSRMDLPQDPGEKFPWTIKARDFSIYSIHDCQRVYYLLKPMAISTTLALTANKHTPSETGEAPGLGLGIHTDMPAVIVKCSDAQVILIHQLLQVVLGLKEDLVQAFDFSNIGSSAPSSALPTSPKRGWSSAQTTPSSPSKSLPHLAPSTTTSSQASSGQAESTVEVQSVSMPSEAPPSTQGSGTGSRPTLGGVKLSLWVQWTLHKLSAIVYGKNKMAAGQDQNVKLCADMEDLTTSIDLQDVYSKVTCKVGALNIHHFVKSTKTWTPGPFKGVLLSCTDTMSHNIEMSPPFKRLRTNSQTANPFSLHSSKAAETKQTHAFISLTWTSALGTSLAQKMSGGKTEKQGDGSKIGEESSKQKHFVNEVIISSQAFDLIIWCPIIASTLDVLMSGLAVEGISKPDSVHAPWKKTDFKIYTIPEAKIEESAASDAMSWQSISHRSTKSRMSVRSLKSSKPSSGISDWLTSSKLPLLYLDCKQIRSFIPAGPLNDQGGPGLMKGVDQDLFLFQISQISLVPYADNPLQRLVVKQDTYRKATVAGITQQPGSEVEDRQYQLDVNGISLNVASWEQVMRSSEQVRMKVTSGVTRSKTQNPALEWNLSLPTQDPEEVKLMTVIQEFDLHLVAAPSIVMEKTKVDKGKQKVIVCGHSLEFHISTDLNFYVSAEQVHLAYLVLDSNLRHLLHLRTTTTSSTDHGRPHPQQPTDPTKPPSSLEDSGLGSDCGTHSPPKEFAEATRQTVASPPRSSGAHDPKVVSMETGEGKPKKKSKMKGVTPFDFLMTGRKVTLFLYSSKGELKSKTSSKGESKRSLLPPIYPTALEPFILLVLSQPSLVMSVEKKKQKLELSFYDFRIDGAPMNKQILDHSVPQAMDYPIPWFQTCQGVADPKTGVKPALFTFTVTDFMMQSAAVIKMEIARPLKVNFSLTKVQQAREFAKRLQPIRSQEISKVPREVKEIKLMTTPRSGEKSVGISLPGQQTSQREKTRKPKSSAPPEGVLQNLMMLSHFQSAIVVTSQMVVVIATTPDPDFPHIVTSVGGICFDSEFVVNQKTEELFQADSAVQVYDFTLKTSLQQCTEPLLGPVTFDLQLRTNHEPHSASELSPFLPRIYADLNVKSVPISFGQENLNCLKRVIDQMNAVLAEGGKGREKKRVVPAKKFKFKIHPSAALPPIDGPLYSEDEEDYDVSDDDGEENWEDVEEDDEEPPPEGVTQIEYKDDLRTGAFEYFTEGHTEDEIPLPNQIYFTPPSQEGGHWGTMVWTYPEPRMDVGLTITPVPISNPDVRPFGRTSKIPCILQAFNSQRQSFGTVREFFVSETQRYHKKQKIIESRDLVEEMDAHSTWRVVLNTNVDRLDMQDPLSPPTPDIILTPMALAASMRFDTVFAPRFIQFCHLKVTVGLIELRMSNHLGQLGKGIPEYLKGFTPDESTPRSHEFMVAHITETRLDVESYGGVHARTRICGTSGLEIDLLNYHNLTMSPLLEKVETDFGYSFRSLVDIEGQLGFSNMTFIAGQGTVHTLSKVAQAWKQNLEPEAERLFYGHYLICNSTNQALRFGQVHTDESVVLKSGEMHEYSWRTHKKEKQELHVCMENWRNFRWSEPFSIDGEDGDTTVRVLHNRDHTATIFIQIRKITAVQRQIIITGTQTFSNQLTIPLDVQVTRRSFSQTSPRSSSNVQETRSLQPNSSLPALTCSDDDIIGVCVKVQGSDCDWSEQFALSGEMCATEMVVKVPCADGRRFYFWCQIFTETHDGNTQRLVVFSPLFTLQSHLPFPVSVHCQAARGNDTQVVEVRGQGSLQQLYQIPPLSWYSLTLTSVSESVAASSSSAAVCISTEMFENITHHPDEAMGLKRLADNQDDLDMTKFWPYNHPDYSSSKLHASSLQGVTIAPHSAEAAGHPSASLQVGMVQHRSKVNTIRVEIMPCFWVVNETDMDFTIMEEGGKSTKVTARTTSAPQKFKANLSLSLSHEGEDYVYNDSVNFLNDVSTPPKKNEPVQGLQLQPEDHGTIELVSRGVHLGTQKVVHVVMQSTVKHQIRILTIRPRFVFRNNSKHDLKIRMVNLRSEEKIVIQANTIQAVTVPSKSSEHTPHLKWGSPACSQPTGSFHYLSLALCDQSAAEGAWLDEWSAWFKVDSDFPRVPLTLPITKPSKTFQSKNIVTCPMVAMVYCHQGMTYVTFDLDPSPKVLVINRCPFPVHIGHSQEHTKVEEALEIEEEFSPMPKIPIVPSASVIHYNPPLDAQSKQSNVHKFHFAIAKPPGSVTVPSSQSLMEGGSKVEGQQWSEAVDIVDSCNPTRSEIVSMPSGGYLLVATECVGTLIHIFVDSLNSRDEQVEESQVDPPQISQSIGTAGIVVKVMNDQTPGLEVKEVLRVTAKGVSFLMVAREDLKRTKALHALHLLTFSVAEIQIDNQSQDGGGYDFPVVFRGHERSEDNFLPDIDHNHQLTPERWYNFVYAGAQENRESSFLWVHVFVEGNEGFGDRLRNAEVAIHNMEVYIEDQFLRNAKSLVETYSPSGLVQKAPSARSGPPLMVTVAMDALRSPIGLQQLTILPISLTASIHATLKMFISLDQTRLQFQRYETGPIYATHRQLGQALTLHYTSGALFKAGWAIGSLDLIGNPAGFLRSVRTGLFDTVYLPYEGLTRGPSAFVAGVASGMSSLVRHLSAGTLTSITKFASSMSRNLDRLSLDADHVARREEERRRIPEGMSSAIVQGLSSFGISLLGAIAGLADQPLRSFQGAGTDPSLSASPSQRARGVISGVGKGLVGAVVKPLGGAAELVAQTGQGILHGTGLAEKLTPLGAQFSVIRSSATNARLKYEWKMLKTLPTSEILYHVDITSMTVQGLQRGGALLLTPEVLYVVSSSEDMQQLTLPLCDIACGPVRFNEKMLKVIVKGPAAAHKEKHPLTADRVADYVAATSDTSGHEDEPTAASDSPSEASERGSQEVRRSYQYSMEMAHRETFLVLYTAAKNRLGGIGFCYDEGDNIEYRQWQLAAEKAKMTEM
ncbi:intermembrane lipid transfer protein VPS13B-like [Lytechinus pictus]|uniref:intermembrane lipid transfer protein VPS13B-like n=1 Tax=Lytechinus pictus TaxID=7653 RepID=UPI0030BA1F65